MSQTTSIDSRRTDLNPNLDARTAEVHVSAQSDFARGQRTSLARALVAGDFATGMRHASLPGITGDFATGMRSSHGPVTTGDFATGMRTLRVAAVVDNLTPALDNDLPLAA
jgi:hypothetical protein